MSSGRRRNECREQLGAFRVERSGAAGQGVLAARLRVALRNAGELRGTPDRRLCWRPMFRRHFTSNST